MQSAEELSSVKKIKRKNHLHNNWGTKSETECNIMSTEYKKPQQYSSTNMILLLQTYRKVESIIAFPFSRSEMYHV